MCCSMEGKFVSDSDAELSMPEVDSMTGLWIGTHRTTVFLNSDSAGYVCSGESSKQLMWT